MKIILHGMLAEQFGAEHFIMTDVPADAIEGLSRQLEGWPRDLVIDAVGFATHELLFAPTEATELHLMPAMFGGGGIGKIVLGVALVAFAIWNPLAMAAWAVTLAVSVGASIAMMGVSELLMKAPTTDKANDPPASKYLGISQNTVAVGTPIPLAYGRIKIAGHWLSLQSDSNALVTTSFPVSTS